MGIKTAVIGIGNLLLRDEGVGVHTINALRERFVFPGDVELIDGGTMGLDLLPFIEGKDALLIIDAVDFKEEPGSIKLTEGSDIKPFLDMKFSVHQIGLPDMLFAAEFSGITPRKICLVGIQPDIIETGLELSGTLLGKLDELIEISVAKLKEWGVEVGKTDNVPCDSL